MPAALQWTLVAADGPSAETFAQRAKEAYVASKERFKANPEDKDAALQMAIKSFDWAGYQSDDKVQARIAEEGIAASRKLLELEPKSAAGHYYHGMNQGRLAQTKTLGALKLVDAMEAEFKRARELDENYSFAGPDRNLGLLYRDAPGWPASIGSRSKARHHLQRAVILAPNYPENRLNLIEAYLEWGETENAQREISALNKIWDKARQELTGEKWEPDWADWEKRRKEISDRDNKPPPQLHIQRGAK
jgi:hypothetical protein